MTVLVLELMFCRTVFRRLGVDSVLCWSSGGLRRAVPLECRVVGLGMSKVGSQCGQSTAFGRWLCSYAEGCGREMEPDRFFIPGDSC